MSVTNPAPKAAGGKVLLESKTFWVNLLALIAMGVQLATGFAVPPEYQVMALGVINVLLRTVTKEPIAWMIALALVASAALSACAGDVQTATNAVNTTLSSDTAQKDYALACAAYGLAKTGFNTYVALNKVEPTALTAETKVTAVIDPLCMPPYPTDIASAYAKIIAAVSQLDAWKAITPSVAAQPANTPSASAPPATASPVN